MNLSISFQLSKAQESRALELFHFQYAQPSIYQQYCNLLSKTPDSVSSIEDIPFLPISFFKSHTVTSKLLQEPEVVFQSSGTTGMSYSKHAVYNTTKYNQVAMQLFTEKYGDLSNFCILALLPGYLERGNSSLVYMVNHFIEQTNNSLSGFYLRNFIELKTALEQAQRNKQPCILWGVSYALLDFGQWANINLSNCIIMETGGMKGTRKEMVKEDFHNKLKSLYGVTEIHSEYGMTELLSQAYSSGNGIFEENNSLAVGIREVTDPFSYVQNGRTGGINIIDFANEDSCSFIETADLGRKTSATSFEVLGRFDHAELRGCNLLVV